MRALLWNHRFTKISITPEWNEPYHWMTKALRGEGWEVLRHPDLRLGFNAAPSDDLTAADLVIYSHTTARHVRGFDGPQWFVKSTGPTRYHTTLDPLGYGPYSSITYEKPPFMSVSDDAVRQVFEEDRCRWVSEGESKWGEGLFSPFTLPFDGDYILVLAQTLGDDTVTGMWFGDYLSSLMSVVRALTLTSTLPIVVKIHPWTDSFAGFTKGQPIPSASDKVTRQVSQALSDISPSVYCISGMASVHSVIPGAKAVVCCNSGAGLEALLHKKPVITWGYPEYHWVTYDLRHLCDLERALNLDWFDEEAVGKFATWYVKDYCFSDYPSAVRRVRLLLSQIATSKPAFT